MEFLGQQATYYASEPLRSGGDIAVYKGSSSGAALTVAVKCATHQRGADSVSREAAILRRVACAGHPNIIPFQDTGEEGGLPWVATKWLSGGTLAERSREAWGSARVMRLIYALAEGLTHLHTLGVVHADLCPANIGFNEDECPVLLDFGAATEVWDAKTEGASEWSAAEDGAFVAAPGDSSKYLDTATLGYVAPERLLARAWDTRADVYSLACIWYELLTGKPVFASDTETGLFRQHVDVAPLAPSQHGVPLPPELERLLLRSLAKDPHERTARAADIAAALRPHLSLPVPATPEVPIIFRSRLHGRAGAIAALRVHLASARAGVGGLLVISGDSGCGKTRLQASARTLATEFGLTCVSGRAQETVRDLPIASAERELASFADTLRLLAEKLAQAPVSDALLAELSPLAAFDDELGARLPRLAHPVPSDTVFQGLVFDALLKAFELLANERPLFIGLDDTQFADDLTLRFLRSDAMARLRELKVLLVIGWNTSRADLMLSDHAESLRLGPLSPARTGEMLADLLGVARVDPALIELVQRATRGSPLAISEFVAAAARENLWIRSGESWLIAAAFDPSQTLADRVRTRVETLAAPIPRLAGLAAVLGDEFSLTELAQLDRDRDGDAPDHYAELESAMEALLLQRVIVPAGPRAYRFTHGIHREVCEDLLDPAQRRELHRTLAARLASNPAARLLQKRIGLHHAAADESNACVTPLRRAARAAMSVHAIEDAIRLLELAWQHARRAAASPALDQRAARTGWDLLRLLMRSAEHTRLRALGEQLGQGMAAPSLLRARVRRLMALSYRVTGDYERVQELLDASTAELTGDGVALRPCLQRELLEHGIMRVSVHYSLRQFAEAASVLRELRPLVRAAAGPTQRAKVYMWQANVIALRSNYAFSRRAVEYERRALAAHSLGQTLSEEYVMSQFDLAFMLLLGGPEEWTEAASLLARAHALAERLNDAVLRCRIVTYRAIAARRTGNELACEDFARVALAAAESSGLRGYVGAAHACLAWAALRRGDDVEAENRSLAALLAWNGDGATTLARNGYPFQWLALLPLLAVRINAERVEECQPLLANLLDASQARLRRPLTRKLALAAEHWQTASERERLDSLDACLRSAAKYRYV